MGIPHTYTDVNETGCCAVPDVGAWDRRTVEFTDQRFIRRHTRSVLHVPLNMSAVMTGLQETASTAHAETSPERAMVLSRDLSPWRAEHLYAVAAPVEGADNVVLNGRFATRVFEGPFSQARSWHDGVGEYARSLGSDAEEVYFLYTTCPKCAKHYGKNYVIALARLRDDLD